MKPSASLLEANVSLSAFVEGNPVATFVIDAEHRVVCWNKACAMITGIPASRMIGTNEHWRAFYPRPRPLMADLILDGCREGDIYYYYGDKFRPSELISGACEAEDYFPDFGDGGRWLFFTAAPVRDSEGDIIGAIETLQDFTARRLAEAALRDKEAFLAQVVDGHAVATLVIDHQHQITHWNRACASLTGFSAERILVTRDRWRPTDPDSRPLLADLVLEGAIEADFHRFYCGNLRKSTAVEGAFETEEFIPETGGEGKWLFFTAAPLLDWDGKVIGAIETRQDITERRLAEEQLRQSEERYRQLSVTDALTQLYNARHFNATLDQELERSARYRRPLTLCIVDVDDFKRINDSYGHAEGDRVLQGLSATIQSCLRDTDTAYRYGGEEFAVLMPETTAEAGAVLAERLRQRFAEAPVTMPDGTTLSTTVSVGVTHFHPGDDARSLFCRADDGMYQAKRHGKNRVVVVEPPSGP
jgi:diguanylate cyclase (GGDEF)-like protein